MDDRLLLQVKGLRTWFHTFKGVVKAVDDVSFDIRVGEVLAVVGESGGGKSVTGFSVIRLIDEPGRIESGEVLFAGRDLMKLSEREMNRVRGKDISMVFQDAMTSLNPVYTIGQQIDEGVDETGAEHAPQELVELSQPQPRYQGIAHPGGAAPGLQQHLVDDVASERMRINLGDGGVAIEFHGSMVPCSAVGREEVSRETSLVRRRIGGSHIPGKARR